MYNKLIEYVLSLYNLSMKDFYMKGQKRDLADARAILSHILHRKEDLTLKDVGKIIFRKHNTVIFHLDKADSIQDKDFTDKLDLALEFYYKNYCKDI